MLSTQYWTYAKRIVTPRAHIAYTVSVCVCVCAKLCESFILQQSLIKFHSNIWFDNCLSKLKLSSALTPSKQTQWNCHLIWIDSNRLTSRLFMTKFPFVFSSHFRCPIQISKHILRPQYFRFCCWGMDAMRSIQQVLVQIVYWMLPANQTQNHTRA